jgi:hypothetical protein
MKTRWIVLFLSGWAWVAAPADGATVSITPATSTVAQGGSAAFTVTATPSTYVQQVTVSYQGEVGQDVGTSTPFYTSHTFDTPANGLVVTATVTYWNGDPAGQATATVDVVGLKITGPASPQRGYATAFLVQSNPSGKTLSQINWSYVWPGGSNTYQNSAAWSGKLVVDGTLTVSAVVSGVLCQASQDVHVTPRNWSTPVTCAQDNDPNYGDLPTTLADLGSNRDQDSNVVSYIFVPRNGGFDFSPACTLAQVSVGPCAGLWYVAACTLKCQRETVINRYIKPDGPVLGDTNFAGANANCFSTSVGDFVQAVKNHEYRGTPDTFKSPGGHQGRIEGSILDDSHDAKQHIEEMTGQDYFSLLLAVNTRISNDESAVYDCATDEWYLQNWGPNWGSEYGLGTGLHSCWDPDGQTWTGCVNEPGVF